MKIYACNINDWDDLSGLEFLSDERKRRVERYMQPKDKVRCLVGGLLLYYALGHNTPPMYAEYGKPYFENERCFNISHSGDYVVLALSDYTLGVDIEKVKPYSANVAEKCFTPPELDWLSENNDDKSFYKIWSAKESIMKATGRGFHLSPISFQVLPIKDGPHIINTEKWYLYWHSLDNHEICVSCLSAVEQNNDVILLSYDQIMQKIMNTHAQQQMPPEHKKSSHFFSKS